MILALYRANIFYDLGLLSALAPGPGRRTGAPRRRGGSA